MIPLPGPREKTQFTAETQGEIWFNTRAPFGFDMLLNDLDAVPELSASGYLFPLHANNLVVAGHAALVLGGHALHRVDDHTVPYGNLLSNVTDFDVETDDCSGLKAPNRYPAIDPERIGVMGFSDDGIATRHAMDPRLTDVLAPDVPPFAAHVDCCGPCLQDIGTVETTGAPLMALSGAHDLSNDPGSCTIREEELRAAGSEVSATSTPLATSWAVISPVCEDGIRELLMYLDDKL